MTTTQFILIILAVAIIVWGIIIIAKAFRKKRPIEHLPPSDTGLIEQETTDANTGLPIVPRHERPEVQSATVTEPGVDETMSSSISKNVAQTRVQNTNQTPISDSFEENRQQAIQADRLSTDSLTTDSFYRIDKMDNPNIDKTHVASPALSSAALLATSTEPDAFSALANATETLTPVVQTYDENQLKNEVFSENSPILDTHIQAQLDQEQNSPLNNAEQNINISLFPNNQFDHIAGQDLLQLVDKYGLKYGAMNMFHRYENKEGTGLLWFSMMMVDDDGVSPFDLNKLPTQSLKGLILFLSLPHPKAVQGFDSMMSIAGMMAQDLDASLYDENGEPMSRENTQYLREMATDYGR